MAADSSIKSQTMQFRDNVPGTVDERGAVMDPSRDLALLSDATLDSWFSRPIQIADYTWDVDSELFQRLNPWTLFWENERNIEKIKNYHLLRAKLHVKILINGNAFYYGRAIAAYEPLSPLDTAVPERTWFQQDIVRGSQRMHIYINPTMSAGGSLELPFFWPKNNWVVGANDWRNMGTIVIKSLNDLKHANGSTDPLNVTVFAWAEDVRYEIPTRGIPSTTPSAPEAGVPDEHEQDVISRPATNVARVAGALSDVPVIGRYAKATEMGAKAVASTAKMFGFSAPNDLHQSIFEPRAKHSLAVTDTKQSANKLTVDSKQELTIDPCTTGIQSTDEMPIASIAGRESYLTTFSWPITATTGTHLWNARVDPGLKQRNGSEWHFPACALAALPFQYWRGTMRFRFQIVASEYHKGRLRISYDPRIGGSNPEFNTQYTTIHDIADNKDFTVDVGWGQDVPFRESLGWYSNIEYDTQPLTIPNSLQGNGVITLNVLNKLSAPAVDTSAISVNVFISMLDDFEVAAPDDKISYLRYRREQFVPPPLALNSVPESGVPDANDADDQHAPITDPTGIDEFAETQIDVPETTKIFMGEVISSFRTLIKRSYLSELRIIPDVDQTSVYKISRGSFPTYGGYITDTPQNGSMVTSFTDTRYYNTAMTTMLNYLGRAFLGWRGSTRWTIDTSSLKTAFNGPGGSNHVWNSLTFSLARRNTFSLTQTLGEPTGLLLTSIPQYVNNITRGEDCNGLYLGNTNVNPIQTIEVPYLQNDRFKYTFHDDNFVADTKGPGWTCTFNIPGSADDTELSAVKLYTSAGEDFNLFFFNGLPYVFYEPTYPYDEGG